MVLTSKPKTYDEAVDSAIDIEEGLRSHRARRQQVAQGGRPTGQGAQSSQSSHSAHQPQQQQQPQVAQQSGRQRFRPRGQQFKKKSGSGSSGLGSSSSSGSLAEFCGHYGGKNPSTQCVVDWAVKMRIRPPELETSICDVKYHVLLVGKL
ncbi:hypothetical protein F511_42321 [Dorcoceras hygrometricum]|uniref:Uncharacterized protein n=1 Tax=Dorcoceras hygrometricum TaxID=472368 RepID=A0A2Z7BUN7_9LAMI|nr:hypothetical protein F511_42321 [Dorcoceras hygrometricum]